MRIVRRRLVILGLGLGLLLGWAVPGRAQIFVDDLSGPLEPIDLVERLLGGGVQVFNIEYTGVDNASGVFCTGLEAVGLQNGILLTSGDVFNVPGPNDSNSAGTSNGQDGDADLDGLIPGFTTFDASILEFDFVAEGPEVTFTYVFASEEYNEYVDSPFNDVFGFFVNGVNFALLPGTTTPVSINNVNNGFSSSESAGPCQNCEFFIDNVGTNNKLDTQMDGLTTILQFTAPVTPGETNHLKIAIADAGDGILDSAVFLEAGSLRSISTTSTNCVTRESRYWFTHYRSDDPNCVTLERAMERELESASCFEIDLGFMTLPVGFHNNDNISDHVDATIEALGLYYRKQKRTGELGGTQSAGRAASKLCVERKRLAVEFISALANTLLLETKPELCSYVDGGVVTNFPADLVDQARDALRGPDLDAVRAFTVLLKKFNQSGVTNDFKVGFLECNASPKKELKKLSRDPTRQENCPGINDACASAESVYFAQANDPFAVAAYQGKAKLNKYFNNLPSPACASGGAEAVWKIAPPVASAGRQFTVRTTKSNIDTVVSVYAGTCDDLALINCATRDASGLFEQAAASFTTDGTNTYYIVIEGQQGEVGSLKVNITSP